MSVSPSGAPALLERTDVYKSCKSLEVLLNVLNDYCEAAGAVVTLQKRLAKALKEMASSKVTGDIPSNALNACATIFESLSEVDGKFSKFADKEYDVASADVKKWFKKLAKEEKAHDDKLNTANGRIKQAAQLYEKKAKRSPHDATEEHMRYVNLISSLGAEMSQEKYNYALNVTQRHLSTIYIVAASVSRIADAEWLRTCEQVRRFAPTIGVLGQWKSYCEGGWEDPLPQDLTDIRDDHDPDPLVKDPPSMVPTQPEGPRAGEHHEPIAQAPTLSMAPSAYAPPRPQYLEDNTGSVRTLSAFPIPPTHVPVPHPHPRSPLQPSPPSPVVFPSASSPQDEERASPLPPRIPDTDVTEAKEQPAAHSTSTQEVPSPQGYSSTAPVTTSETTGSNISGNDKEQDDISADGPKFSKIERTGTTTSIESRVAAMRHRYSESQPARTTSPGPRDIPRLPLSVSGLASRYDGGDAPSSPPLRTPSPPTSRRQTLPPLDTVASRALETSPPRARTPQRSNSIKRVPVASPTPSDRKRQSEIETELRARERRLQDLELDIRRRELELEQSRNSITRREEDTLERQRRISSQQRPVSMANVPQSPSKHQLGAPSSPLQHREDYLTSRTSNRSAASNMATRDGSDHAPYCGCERCSTSKYSQPNIAPSPHDLRAPERPITLRPEKPKGWIRRLSMPVGNAFLPKGTNNTGVNSTNYGISKSGGIFSLDGRKNMSVVNFSQEDGRLGVRRSYDSQAIGNRSMTNLTALRR